MSNKLAGEYGLTVRSSSISHIPSNASVWISDSGEGFHVLAVNTSDHGLTVMTAVPRANLRRELTSLLCPFLDNENVCEIACCTALKIGQYQFPKMKDINSYSSSILNLERNCYVCQF